MRNFTYWLCFGLVAFANIMSLGLTLMYTAGINQPNLQFLSLFMAFRSLVPELLADFVPRLLAVPLFFVMTALVARRLWLFSVRGERVPHSYTGLQLGLGYLGALSFMLTALALVLTIVLQAGSGVPAGLVLIPAVFCIPWAFFLTEVFSFRQPKKAGPAMP
jgi:hypothetical protein